ncbi:hypothetical protein AB0K48_18590 [Nonomuraea sp. NPDC055795]
MAGSEVMASKDEQIERPAASGWATCARFAAETTYGILLVPDPTQLDPRRPMPPEVRAGRLGAPVDDVPDDRAAPAIAVP